MEEYLEQIERELPELADSFGALALCALKEGAVSMKHKELIALGISVAVRCERCIRFHIERSLAAGCSKKEILEAASVAVMMQGGPAYTTLAVVFENLKHV